MPLSPFILLGKWSIPFGEKIVLSPPPFLFYALLYCSLCVFIHTIWWEIIIIIIIRYIIKADLELICDDLLLWKNLRQRLVIINPSWN